MGTRGIFYLYVTVGDKRILIYAFYTQYDGHDVIHEISLFFRQIQWPATIDHVIDHLSSKYKPVQYFPGDAEAVAHYNLTPISEVSELEPGALTYMPAFESSYGGHITGRGGDCYYGDITDLNYVQVTLDETFTKENIAKAAVVDPEEQVFADDGFQYLLTDSD